MLRPAGCLIYGIQQLCRRWVRWSGGAPDLPATDASAWRPSAFHLLRHQLPDVALPYPRLYLCRGYVPLYPLDADVFGNERFHPCQEVHGYRFVVRNVLAVPPHIVYIRAAYDKERVELQHVRTVSRIIEQPAKAFQILLRIRSGQPGHDVIADLQPPVPAILCASADLGDAVAPVDPLKYIIVQDLNAQLHAGRA